MSECLLYYIKEGLTVVGQKGDIVLTGEFILDKHCSISNENGNHSDFIIQLYSCNYIAV